ncbi:MAG: hypothetical protein ACOZEN_12295 [Thermodesulfobacteriota bacterium]
MANVFGVKSAAAGIQPWEATLSCGKDIRNLYESLGSVTLTGTNEIATLLDGPEKVVMYDDLTVGDGTTASSLTVTNRCKGLTIIVRGNLLVRNNAAIKMTARGARIDRSDDPRFPFIDFRIPNKIGLYSQVMSRNAALELIARHGFAPWDRGFWDSGGGPAGLNCAIVEAGTITLLSASGCAAGAAAQSSPQPGYAIGLGGNAGVNGGCGSGGHGGLVGRVDVSGYPASHGTSGSGSPYGGGNATSGHSAGNGYGALTDTFRMPVPYSMMVGDPQGAGAGGAGIQAGSVGSAPWGGPVPAAGGEGVGGKLAVICYGNITVEAGGRIESNGMPGGAAGSTNYGAGGGGSGGGHISLIHAGSCANNGTVQCAGGVGGAGNYAAGGSGGAGSVVTKTFAQMGWA